MGNMINSKLLELLSGVDKNKLASISNIVNNMPKEDLNALVNMLGNQMPASQDRSSEQQKDNN